MHENWGNSFFCPLDKKMISPHIEWCIGKGPVIVHTFFKLAHKYLKYMLYYVVI